MPKSIEVKHPNKNVSIKFTEDDHSYVDSCGRKYTSVTTLIGNAFPKFDSENIAKRISAKSGEDWHLLVEKWEKTGEKARTLGTRLHEICESTILGKEWPHEPVYENEKNNFKLCSEKCKFFLNELSNDRIKELKPELLVFSPDVKIAGSIDLLVKYSDNHYHIFDWKNLSKPIEKNGYDYGSIPPTKNVPNTNYWHYALQLQLYEILLKIEGYIDIHANVDRSLLVINDNKITEVPLESMLSVAKSLLKWNKFNTIANFNIK